MIGKSLRKNNIRIALDILYDVDKKGETHLAYVSKINQIVINKLFF